MKIETYLPLFSGFYNTIWNDSEDWDYEFFECVEIPENLKKYDLQDVSDEALYSVNHQEREKDVVLSICETLPKFCPLIKSIELEEVISPREYNFYNDSADVIIDVDMKSLQKWIDENEDFLDRYFKKRYTSYDGFWSRYPDSYGGWDMETDQFTNLDGHYLGSILEAWFIQNKITELDIYYDVDIYSSFDYINWQEVENSLSEKEMK
jgi:hypothetical protein